MSRYLEGDLSWAMISAMKEHFYGCSMKISPVLVFSTDVLMSTLILPE